MTPDRRTGLPHMDPHMDPHMADRRTGWLASLVVGSPVRVRDLNEPTAPACEGSVTHITPTGHVHVIWMAPIGWSWTKFGPRGRAFGLRLEAP